MFIRSGRLGLAFLGLVAVITIVDIAMITSRDPDAATADADVSPAVRRASTLVSAGAIREHVQILSDDRFEGRETGTPGFDLAARYVAAQFRSLGLAPGVGDSAYLQPIPLRRSRVEPAACELELQRELGGGTLRYGADYLMRGDPLRERWTLDAGLVFVGYGVTAPELGHDDYAGLDTRGKCVVMLSGAPPAFPGDQRAHYSNAFVKEQAAAAHGASGIFTVRSPVDRRRQPWARSVAANRMATVHWLDPGGAPHDVFPQIEAAATLDSAAAARLFEGSAQLLSGIEATLDSVTSRGFQLPGRVRVRRATRHEAAASANVIGILPGTDPRLRDEFVVLSSHLDHLGIGAPVNGDSIYNGALDNASGIAAMLEIARAMREGALKPKRSIVFLAVTGEEKGLLGSDYFARFPPMGRGRVVANVNVDQIMMLGPMHATVVFGAEHSTLAAVFDRAARAAGVERIPDPVPQEVVFIRSDQYSFVRQGIPAAFPVHGGSGAPEDRARRNAWFATTYHQPNDEFVETLDWDSGATMARMVLFALWDVANAATAPRWNPGDFFGEKFGPKR